MPRPTADEIREKLLLYRFTDEYAHYLEHCVDYQNLLAGYDALLAENAALREVVEAAEAYVALQEIVFLFEVKDDLEELVLYSKYRSHLNGYYRSLMAALSRLEEEAK